LFIHDNINPYEVLELSPFFYQFWTYQVPSANDVKDAFHHLSLKYHPDKQKKHHNNIHDDVGDQNDKYFIIRDAYDYLKG
jgi:preprotein translocase subunit Sec63